MSRLPASLLVLALLALLGAATAQHALLVNGREAGEARTDVVPGHAYAPASALAGGLGAELAAPAGTATAALSLGGHLLQVDVVDDPAGATRSGAVRRAGAPVGDLAAVRGDDALWLPVAPVARALGAQVAFQPERGVVVLTPRPVLEEARLERDGAEETLVLRFDAPVAWRRFENAALGLTELEAPRARLARARTLRADVLERVDLLPERSGVRVRLDAPGATLRIVALRDGAGTELRVVASRGGTDAGTPREEAVPLVVLDAAGAQGTAARALAEAVADRLRREGVRVELAPAGTGVETRAASGAPADLFASFAAAELPRGEVRVWVLGDADPGGAGLPAVARNAATALAAGVEDEVRRRILLGLAPDLEVGRRYGRALATALFQAGGYRAGTVREAPIAVLAGAAGRGVLLEASTEDVADPRLADAVAAAIGSALGGAR